MSAVPSPRLKEKTSKVNRPLLLGWPLRMDQVVLLVYGRIGEIKPTPLVPGVLEAFFKRTNSGSTHTKMWWSIAYWAGNHQAEKVHQLSHPDYKGIH